MKNFKVKDHSVSKENFELVYNSKFKMYQTIPQPNSEKLVKYYKDENYISHTDAKRNLFERVYHLIRKYTIKQKFKLVNSYKNKGTLLDFGCGTGDFLKYCLDNNWEVKGIEPNESARELANIKT